MRVYDCSGPWGDADFAGNVEQGLPPLRAKWIIARGDVEQVASSYKPIAGRSDASIPPSLRRKPLRAKPGKAVTQLRYARQGIITPEMEFIAIRENLGRNQSPIANRQSPIATWAANPSAPASPPSSPPSSSGPKWPGAAPSSRPTSTIRRASR